jgi:nicotinate-nucleotide adenylyltransferase
VENVVVNVRLAARRPLPPTGDRRRRKVGLLGGSFNPAHQGHRYISLQAMKSLGLDEVWWLVSPHNPLKAGQGMLDLADRVRRARQVARHCHIRVTDIESRLGMRYTADTLGALRKKFPCLRFVWLMGADNLVQIPKWDRWTSIFETLPIAVLDRKPDTYKALSGLAAHRYERYHCPMHRAHSLVGSQSPRWVFLSCRRHPASATDIRQKTGLDKILKTGHN